MPRGVLLAIDSGELEGDRLGVSLLGLITWLLLAPFSGEILSGFPNQSE